jgi:hypothetical protein
VEAGLTGDAYLHPAKFSAGFHTASLISAGLCVAGAVVAAAFIRNPRKAPDAAEPAQHPLSCGLDAPPARAAVTVPAGGQRS